MTSETASDPRPFAGITILDFSRVVAGPFCTALLADQGARIIKIEPPEGDDQRQMGAARAGESVNFHMLNRGKESLMLDLRQPEGRDLAQALARRADVVIENFRPGVAARLGIDAARLCAENPRLIHCAISGFGQSGPLSALPSYDVIAQAMSGLMSVTGEPGRDPVLVGDSIGDTVAGLYAAQAITAALLRRARTGAGAAIDIAMFDALFSLLPTALAGWQQSGQRPQPSGDAHPLSAPFGAYRARDEKVMIAVANRALFQTLAHAIARPALLDDPRFASDALRRHHAEALRLEIEGWTRARPAAEVVAHLSAKGVPAARILGVDEAALSPQAQHRGLLTRHDHPRLGPLLIPEQPAHFAGLARGETAPAPDLGADGPAVLADLLGLSAADITRLRAQNII
ncbi:CaiB/BaiF CoA transferase family protein [Paracoccus aminophilus]|uniref:CoA-transferase n=1 Tax=Paracoccus aminophilus JCM 7686 TaxID=1367847 RepID=S5YHD7_PARAH|nr:CoA transferase [Paracoccus aminophilus]AGT10878.1 CoA-transferase [Paracoccus aminophilus JCM 7686]